MLFLKRRTLNTSGALQLECLYLDHPNYDIPDNHVTKGLQRKWLMEICTGYVETYVMPSDEVNTLVQKVKEFEEHRQEVEANRLSGYICRISGCDVKYVSHSSWVKYVFS